MTDDDSGNEATPSTEDLLRQAIVAKGSPKLLEALAEAMRQLGQDPAYMASLHAARDRCTTPEDREKFDRMIALLSGPTP